MASHVDKSSTHGETQKANAREHTSATIDP
jgi:hypothetical protein